MASDKRGDIGLQDVPNGGSDAFSNYGSDENRSDVAKDNMDMYRLGKKPEFDRNYQLLSITAFTTVAMVVSQQIA